MPPWPVTSSASLGKWSAGDGEVGAAAVWPTWAAGESGAACIEAERTEDEAMLDEAGAQADMAAAPCEKGRGKEVVSALGAGAGGQEGPTHDVAVPRHVDRLAHALLARGRDVRQRVGRGDGGLGGAQVAVAADERELLVERLVAVLHADVGDVGLAGRKGQFVSVPARLEEGGATLRAHAPC